MKKSPNTQSRHCPGKGIGLLSIGCLLLLAVLPSSPACAQTVNQWLGTLGSSWNTPGNWSLGVVPDASSPDLEWLYFNQSAPNKGIFLNGGNYSVDELRFDAVSTYSLYSSGSPATITVENGISQFQSGYVNIYTGLQIGGSRLHFTGGVQGIYVWEAITGGGAIQIDGGYTYFSGSNSYLGETRIKSDARLRAASANALGSDAEGTVVEAGGSLIVQANLAENLSLSGTGWGGAGAVFGSGGTYTLSGTITLAGDTRMGGSLIVAGDLAGGGSLEKVGTGSLFLSGAKSYTGDTVVNGGALLVTGDDSLGSSTNAVQVNADGTLHLNGASFSARAVHLNSGTLSGAASSVWSGPLAVSGTGRIVGDTTVASNVSNAGASLIFGWGENAFTGNLSLGAGGVTVANGLVSYSSGNSSYGGSGRTVLSGSNAYTGATVITGGVLSVASAHALPSTSNLTFQADSSITNYYWNGSGYYPSTYYFGAGMLEIGSSFSRTLGTGAGQVQWLGSGGFAALGNDITASVGTNVTWDSGFFIPTGSQLVLSATSATHNVNFTSNVALGSATRRVWVENGSGAIDGTLSGVISGAGGLDKYGAGTLQLTAQNTFDGNLTIYGGVVEAGTVNDRTGVGPVGRNGYIVLRSGTIRYTGGNRTSDRFATQSIVGSGGIEVTDAATDFVIDSTAFTGSGYSLLTKTGAGALSLAGSASNTNLDVRVAAGNLHLEKSAGSSYAVDDLVIEAGAAAHLNGASSNLINGTLTANGALRMQTRSDDVNYLYGSASGSVSNGATSGDSTLTVDWGGNFAGNIFDGNSSKLHLIVNDYATLTLSGSNSYGGTTRLNYDSTLILQGAHARSVNSDIRISGGILGITSDLSLALNTAPGAIRWGASGGFAAYGGTHDVFINNFATLTIGQNNFINSTISLNFGSQSSAGRSDGTVNFLNHINLANTRLFVNVARGSGGNDVSGQLSGVISNGTGITVGYTNSYSTSDTSYSVGFLRLSNSNTFDGVVYAEGAGIEFDRIGNVGSGAGPLGLASTVANGVIVLNDGVLRYTGSGHQTDRTIFINNNDYSANGYLEGSGSGALKWIGAIEPLASSGDKEVTLVLTGSSTAANEVSGGILERADVFPQLNKAGSGNWIVSGNNTLNGIKAVQGSLTVSGLNYFQPTTTILESSGSAAVNFTGGIAQFSGASDSILQLTGDSVAANVISGTIFYTENGASDRYFALSKTGAGTWTVAGNAALNGLTVNAGRLNLGGSVFLNTGSISVKNTGILRLEDPSFNLLGTTSSLTTVVEGGGRLELAGDTDYNMALDLTGADALRNVAGNNTVTGLTTLRTSTGIRADTGTTLTFDVAGGNAIAASVSGAVLTFLGEGNITVADSVVLSGGAARISKSGTGLLLLSGSNSYEGGTFLHSGTLVVGHNNALGSGGVTVNAGTLSIQTGFTAGNQITLAGGTLSRSLASGVSLANTIASTSSFAGGNPNTTANILSGTSSAASTLSATFSATSGGSNSQILLSDVLHLSGIPLVSGQTTDLFVLEFSMASVAEGSYLGWLNSNNEWVNAALGNTGNNSSKAQQAFAGSFSAFQNGDGELFAGYGTNLAAYIGAWGFTNTSIWAVLNHNSDFGVIPEPSTALLVVLGGAGLAFRRRRARR